MKLALSLALLASFSSAVVSVEPQDPPPQDSGTCSGPHARFYGDPHITTFDGLNYDCQGAGEFVLAKAEGDNPILVTGRFVKSSSQSRTVTVGRAVGIKAVEGVPPIQITSQENSSCQLVFTTGHDQGQTIDGVEDFELNYPNLVRAYADNDQQNAVLIFPSINARVNVNVRSSPSFGCVMSVDLCLSPEKHGNFEGLFGSPNGNLQDDWGERMEPIPRDNTSAMYDQGFDFCMDKCITHAEDSLFSRPNFNAFNFCSQSTFDVNSFMDLFNMLPQLIVDSCQQTNNPQECLLDVSVAVERGEDPMECIEGIKENERQRTELAEIEESDLGREGGRDGWCTPRPESGVNGDPHCK